MNTYTRGLKDGSVASVSTRQRHSAGQPWVFGFAVKIILMCSFIFAAVTCRIMYNAKTEALNKEATRIQMKIKRINLMTANLRNKREELTAFPYINAKIKQYKLGLREADYRQVSFIKIMDFPAKRAENGKHMISSVANRKKAVRKQDSTVASLR